MNKAFQPSKNLQLKRSVTESYISEYSHSGVRSFEYTLGVMSLQCHRDIFPLSNLGIWYEIIVSWVTILAAVLLHFSFSFYEETHQAGPLGSRD